MPQLKMPKPQNVPTTAPQIMKFNVSYSNLMASLNKHVDAICEKLKETGNDTVERSRFTYYFLKGIGFNLNQSNRHSDSKKRLDVLYAAVKAALNVDTALVPYVEAAPALRIFVNLSCFFNIF